MLLDDLPLDVSLIAMKIHEIQNNICALDGVIGHDEVTTGLLYIQRNICGAEISPSTVIGKNLMLVHQGGIVIGGGTIGDNCKIHAGVVIGDRNNDTVCPRIGNDVTIYANSVVYGDITIGDGVIIGPCSVINKSIDKGIVYGYIHHS
jgi:serine O-acetyltransferase